MSYSYSVPVDPYDGVAERTESVVERIDEAISDLPDGPGKDEAIAHRESVLNTLAALSEYVIAGEEGATERVLSVSGHGTTDGQGSINGSGVNVGLYRHRLTKTITT